MNFEINNILKQYGPSVFRLALAKTTDPHLADDIYQQVFLLLLEKKPTFSCSEQLKVWLLRSTAKLCTMELRKFDNSKTEPLDENIAYSNDAELAVDFCELILSLPENVRDVTVLFYIEDMSVNDIAKALSLSSGAVRVRLTRARKLLSKIYKEELL